MSSPIQDIVIVGGGLAAAKAAEAVRADGFAGTVTLVTEEPERPYERPPLSKGFLLGKATADDVYVHGADFYAENEVELVVGDAAETIDRGGGRVVTRSGRELPFDRLLLATGSYPRQLPLGRDELDGIVTLRNLEDSRHLAERFASIDHVTIVGAGWIGCEVAAAARTLGVAVTVVDPLDVPLQRILGEEVGRVFRDLHHEHGVDLRLGVGVSGAAGRDTVEEVTLSDGTTIATELVVVGIGVVPRTELAERADLRVDDGIVVDATLTTDDPRILAAGDVANAWHPTMDRHLRVEHWANALNQGEVAGHNLLGAGHVYDRVPYFFTDQYELGMEYSGYADSSDEVVFRGSVDDGEFIAFWLDDERVVAGMNVNVWDVVEDIQALIRSGARPPKERFADPAVTLSDLAGT